MAINVVNLGTNFATYKANAQAQIDSAATTSKAKYLTSGQDYTYAAKATEAQNYVLSGYPNPTNTANTSNWPYLCADANATATANLAVSASNILSAKATADSKVSIIEAKRVAYRANVANLANSTPIIDSAVSTYTSDILNQ